VPICTRAAIHLIGRVVSLRSQAAMASLHGSLRRRVANSDWMSLASEAGGPLGGFADVRKLGGDVGANGGLEGDDVVQDAEGVFAHFLAGEKLRQGRGEVEAELESVRRDRNADVVIAEEKAAVAPGDGAAGVQEPSLRATFLSFPANSSKQMQSQ